MKVLQLGTSGPLYGAERWILALVRNLDSRHVESHVAAIADGPDKLIPLLTGSADLGFACHSIDAQGKFNPDAIFKLRRLLLEQNFDIIHSHGYKADITAILATRGTGIKTITTPHGWSRNIDWKLRFYEWLDRASFRFFDAVAPLSSDLANGLKHKSLGHKLHLISNGVDLEEIKATNEIAHDLQKLKDNGPVIGYVGQLIPRKNLPVLLKAFAKWKRADASLVLIGEGNQRSELGVLAASWGIQDQTHFVGFQNNRLEWMSGFDLCVLPSLEEGIPRCLMEAMALEVPVIASDIPGNRDLVDHGKTGFLFPAHDITKLQQSFDEALESKRIGDLTANAKAKIERDHSARSMALGYQKLFASLTN